MIIREKGSHDLPRDFVKVAVDIERKILAAGCELHADCADELLHHGSNGKNVWGANVFLDKGKIEFVSMINIRPAEGNRAMEIQLPEIRASVEGVIRALLFPA
jgi:hypothetical protein